MFDHLDVAPRVRVLEGDIHGVTADEPDTKHDACHIVQTNEPGLRTESLAGIHSARTLASLAGVRSGQRGPRVTLDG